MKDEINPADVADAAREGFGPELVRKGEARGLVAETGAAPSVAESVLGRCYAEADGVEAGAHGGAGGGGEAVRRARSLLSGQVVEPGQARAREAKIQAEGEGTLIDRLRAEPNAESGSFTAYFNRLSVKASIPRVLAQAHPRAFRDGFFAEIELAYDPDSEGRTFEVTGLRPLQESSDTLVAGLAEGREAFTAGEWAYFLVQSVGLDPFAEGFVAGGPAAGIGENADGFRRARAVGLALLRLVPLAERRFNLVELGPRETGKSYLYEKIAPRAHLLSGGKASVSKLFVDTRSGKEGLVADQDVVCFDEISSTDFQGDEVVSALKTYMESGKVSRGKTEVRGRASFVMLGNIDAPPRDILRESHLFAPLPDRIKGDTALMDRIHAYLPGWEVPKVSGVTEGLGLTAPYLMECLSRLRSRGLSSKIEERVALTGNLTRRDRGAALQTASGLLKLVYPGLSLSGTETTIGEVPRPVLRWALWMGLEARLRVRQQQHRILPGEFEAGDFRFTIDPDGGESAQERVFLPEEFTK